MYNEKDFMHSKIGEQNIDNREFDKIVLKGDFKTPAIKITIKDKISYNTLNALKNSINLNQGEDNLYLDLGGNIIFIGNIECNIDNIFKIEKILKRVNHSIDKYNEDKKEFYKITYKDLIHTIRLQ